LERKKFRKPRRTRNSNIKTDLREIYRECDRWMELAQDRVHWWVWLLTVLKVCVQLPLKQSFSSSIGH